MKDGWGVYYINKENIKVPPSIEVTKIDPSMVKIKVEKTVSKRIPVTASINGEPMDGYSVVSVVVEPPLVMVEGAESVVDRIKRLKSESIDISGKKETFEEVATVLTNGKIIRVSDDEVKVIVTIKREKK
jgi:YbbR domain-containing protein